MKRNLMADQCINFLKSEQMKKELKDIIKPILEYLFKELSIYLFFFIFFIFTSFLLHLGILVLLIRYNNNINK